MTEELTGRQYRIVPDNSPLVSLLLDTFTVETEERESFPLLPGGQVTLLFPQAGPALLCGPLTRLRSVTLAAGTVYGVRLHCGRGDWLCRQSMVSLCDRLMPLELYLPDSALLSAAMRSCISFGERNALFARTATLNGAERYQPHPLLRRCLELIDRQGGQLRVAELVEAVGCSERHLNRLFRQKVGYSAKEQCELVQLYASLRIMRTTPSRSLLHLAVNSGYFDQAHMNRHYEKFLGCTANRIRLGGGLPPAPALDSGR